MKNLLTTFIFIFSFVAFAKQGFVKNEGQMPDEIKYYAQLNGVNYFVKDDGVYLDFFNAHKIENYTSLYKLGQVVKLQIDNIEDFDFEEGKVISRNNYFKGDKENWQTDVPVYDQIILEEIIEDIDLRLYLDNETPRYDFLVHPGANISKLNYNFSGINKFEVSDTKVEFEAEFATLTTSELFAYQEINGEKVKVDCKFIDNNGKVSFETGSYNEDEILVIDPIVFSSYFGTEEEDKINDMVLLDNNEMIIVGSTRSSSFPITEGVYQGFYNFQKDGFISRLKINGDEREIIYSTYIGGNLTDELTGVGVDFNENVLVSGFTNSSDFPTQNPFQNSLGGVNDIVVAKLSSDGSVLEASTYIGGSGNDMPKGMDIDPGFDIHIVGFTESDNFPTVNAYQNTKTGTSKDAFIVSLNGDATLVKFSTYFGGTGDDIAYGVRGSQGGDLYFCGSTESTDLDIAPGGFAGRPVDRTYNSNVDMFVSKLNDGGGLLELSTYFGGDGEDIAYDIELQGENGFYVVGSSNSSPVNMDEDGLNVSVGAYQSQNQGGKDIVFVKFSELIDDGFFNIQEVLNSTLIGGGDDDIPLSLFANEGGSNLIISGYTLSDDFPVESENETDYNDNKDGFVTFVSNDGSSLDYSEIIGGSQDDEITSAKIDNDANIVWSGITSSSDLFINGLPFKETNSSMSGFIGKNVFGNLNLTSPDQGGNFCRQLNLPINWFVEGNVEDKNYKIQLVNTEDQSIFVIESNYSGTKPLSWNIPSDFAIGTYKLQVIHPNGLIAESSNEFTISSNPVIDDFSIIAGAEESCIGESVTLSVTTEEAETEYEFTWFKDGTDLNIDSASELVLENLQKSDAGNYSVEITGECNPDVTSEDLELIIIDSTAISEQSAAEIVVKESEEANFFIDAVGKDLEYQWFFKGNQLSGQTGSSLSLENVNKSNEGIYYCVVSGKCGVDVRSADIFLKVDPKNNVAILNNNEGIYFEYLITDESTLDFSLRSELSGKAELSIFDALGRKVYDSNMNIKTGNNRDQINISNLNAGLHIISLNLNGKLITAKFVLSN